MIIRKDLRKKELFSADFEGERMQKNGTQKIKKQETVEFCFLSLKGCRKQSS